MKGSPSRPGLQDCNPFVSRLRFRFSGVGVEPPCLENTRVRELLYNGAERFSVENGTMFDIFEISDFKIGIYTGFALPRVRQRRRRFSPPSVVPVGSSPEATGASTPPGIPRRLRAQLLRHLFPIRIHKKKGPGRIGEVLWGSHGGPSQN